MKLTDQLHIIVQNFIKISVLFSCFRKNHGQMQRYRTDVKTPFKNRNVFIICWIRSASFIPGGQICSAAHRRNRLVIFMPHFSDCIVTVETGVIRIHRFSRRFNSFLKHILVFSADSMKILGIQENQLRKQHRDLISFFALSLSMNSQNCFGNHFFDRIGSKAKGNCGEWIISTAACHGVELVFPALITLFHFPYSFIPCIFLSLFQNFIGHRLLAVLKHRKIFLLMKL